MKHVGKEQLCRARLYGVIERPQRNTTIGWKKCNRCGTCQRSENLHSFRCSATGEIFEITDLITCKDCNVIYIIECQRCNHKPQYAGKTKGCLMVRGGQHRRLVQDELLEKPKLYQHFSSNGHSVNDMKFFAIEVVKGDVFTLEACEDTG